MGCCLPQTKKSYRVSDLTLERPVQKKASDAAKQSTTSPSSKVKDEEFAEFKSDIHTKVQAVHDKISNMEDMLQVIMRQMAKKSES